METGTEAPTPEAFEVELQADQSTTNTWLGKTALEKELYFFFDDTCPDVAFGD